MNVIVTNKQKEIIDNANIDAIKDFNGLFNVDDLINKIKNYFFSRLILDATSIVNFSSKDVLEKLATSIGADRLIILLPTNQEPPQEFVNMLISLKIYNYSTKINDIVNFIARPNTYEDVIGNSKNNQVNYYVDNSIKANNQPNQVASSSVAYPPIGNDLFNPIITEPSTNNNDVYQDNSLALNNEDYNIYKDYTTNVNPIDNHPQEKQDQFFNQLNNFGNYDDKVSNNTNNDSNLNDDDQSNIVSTNEIINDYDTEDYDDYNSNNLTNANNSFYNMDNYNNMVEDNNNNNYSTPSDDVNSDFYNHNDVSQNENVVFYLYMMHDNKAFVLGVKNITAHAGSTTLVYLLMKMAREKLNLRVNAIEINKNDFKYYNDSDMISITTDKLINVINSSNANLIIVDMNDYYGNFDFFDDIIYLVEPSVIRLNKLMMENRYAFVENSSHKMMLNMSLLNSREVDALSKEAGINFIMNVPPLNDRISNDIILKILSLFGFK